VSLVVVRLQWPHGFVILDRIRQAFPHTTSALMYELPCCGTGSIAAERRPRVTTELGNRPDRAY